MKSISQPYENSISLSLGGMVFSIASETPFDDVLPTDPFYPFLCSDQPDVIVRCRSVSFRRVNLPAHRRLYADGDSFGIYRFNRRVFLMFGPADSPGMPYVLAVSNEEFRKVVVYGNLAYGREFVKDVFARILQYPLLPIIMVYFLGAKAGLMVHGCGIESGGKGYLFAGKCGEGKSTMARLWKNKGLVLNDERVVVRRRQGRFWVYGTPWAGEYGSPSPAGAPLEAIFFLSHGNGHQLERSEKAEAAALLLARSFPPLWDGQELHSCLRLMSDLVGEVPCYQLSFAPSEGVVDFIRCLT